MPFLCSTELGGWQVATRQRIETEFYQALNRYIHARRAASQADRQSHLAHCQPSRPEH